MPRFDIINYYIRTRGYKSFLEIGTLRGDTFRTVQCEHKVSVDPDPSTNATHIMTSDEFFANTREKFDLIFIDGLHHADQVWRDISNGLKHLRKKGMIILHDCKPENEPMQRAPIPNFLVNKPWTGDCWKAFLKARATLPYDTFVYDHDMGCGIIDTATPADPQADLPSDIDTMSWNDFTSHPEWFRFTHWNGGV